MAPNYSNSHKSTKQRGAGFNKYAEFGPNEAELIAQMSIQILRENLEELNADSLIDPETWETHRSGPEKEN